MKLIGINFPFWSVTTAFRPLGISENGHNIDLYNDLNESKLDKVEYFKVLKIIEDILISFWFYKPVNHDDIDSESYTLAHSYFFQESENNKKIFEFIDFLVSKYEVNWDIKLKKGIWRIDYYKSPIDKIYHLLFDISRSDFDAETDFVTSKLKRLFKMLTFQDNKLFLRSNIESENDTRQDSGQI